MDRRLATSQNNHPERVGFARLQAIEAEPGLSTVITACSQPHRVSTAGTSALGCSTRRDTRSTVRCLRLLTLRACQSSTPLAPWHFSSSTWSPKFTTCTHSITPEDHCQRQFLEKNQYLLCSLPSTGLPTSGPEFVSAPHLLLLAGSLEHHQHSSAPALVIIQASAIWCHHCC